MKKHLMTVALFFAAVLVAICLAGVVSAEEQPASPDTQVAAPPDSPSTPTTDTQAPSSTDAPASTEAPTAK